MDADTRARLRAEIRRVFTPNRPISTRALFAGRLGQIIKVRQAIRQPGQHVIIYGERGVGKTSLANVIAALIRHPNRLVVVHNCRSGVSFEDLWRDVFREIPFTTSYPTTGFGSEPRKIAGHLAELLPERGISPELIRLYLERYPIEIVIILDEIDRIRTQRTIAGLADTIKTLSDHDILVTTVLIGVGDSVDQLIAEHRSVQRALVQVPMPRMSRAELFQIVDNGLKELAMSIDESAKRLLATLSQGLPHYTHLLAQHAALAAVAEDRCTIEMTDVWRAMKTAMTDAQQSIKNAYHKATQSPQENTLFAKVLLACAMAPEDELGFFAPADVRQPMCDITQKNYKITAFSRHLNDFCDEKRGAILQKIGSKRTFRYRFSDPLMEPYIIIKGLTDGFITEDQLNFGGDGSDESASLQALYIAAWEPDFE